MSNTNATLYKYEILHLNIRGARANKANLLQYLSDCGKPEVITLNETKLGTNIQFELPGYNCASRRENSLHGGSHGSMIMVRSDISDIVEIEETKDLFPRHELLGICIKGNNIRPEVKIFTFYIPPRTHPEPRILQFLGHQTGNCILIGDLNCKNLVWGSRKTDAYGEELHDQIQHNNLFILNDGSKTRCDPVSGKEEALDIAIANFGALSMFRNFWIGDDVGSDHYPVHVLFQFNTKPHETNIQEQRMECTNWKVFQQHMSATPALDACNNPQDIDAAVELITNQITAAFDVACPARKKRNRKKYRFTTEIETKVKEKRQLRRDKNKAYANNDLAEVRRIMTRMNFLGNEIKKMQKLESKKELERHCEKLNQEKDPKKFFQIFRKIANPIMDTEPTPTNTRKIQDEWGNSASTSQEKATLFANRLRKVHQEPEYHGFDEGWKTSVERYLADNQKVFKINPMSQYIESEDGDESMLLKPVSIAEMKENLAKCKNKSAPGQDNIKYAVIKRLPDTFLSQIAHVFSSCLKLGYFPLAWKSAKTILIPKPGKDAREAKNFRPISLLSCLGKLLERIIARRLSCHMEENGLFTESQSGFRAKHMTAEQLLRLSEECHLAFKQKKIVAAIFLDAEAAFDKCWHSGIKHKLKKNLNLPDRMVRLLSSFLTDRSLTVFHEGHWSNKVNLGAGTPQGSPLSPLIYLIYVNDFPKEIQNHCKTSQFADDTSLYAVAYTQQYATLKLQKGLDLLEGWCRRWRVKLNAEKSKFVFFSRLQLEKQTNYRIALFDDTIKPSEDARFLGVQFDHRLTFNTHINESCARANKRLNVLRAIAKAGVSPQVSMRLYKMYVLTLLEYGSAAFLATTKTNKEKLQKVQNEALRICLNLPRYIRIDLLHEYGGIDRVEKEIKKLNKHLLNSMSSSNKNIADLISDQHLNADLQPLSPLDILKCQT